MSWQIRDWFSNHLDVDQSRKEGVYCRLLRSLKLRDLNYWLQVLFSAGIATLGLVLNSPAVIIGAMLISPLMGPILANGLAFAVGDFILGLRAFISISLSCLVAIAFAAVLIAWMPFKTQTPEIAARIQPNVLDLVIALFSGALGALATCTAAQGGVTAIPGVAIAVALMPPLCVVGYGLGLGFSLDPIAGIQVARGGGLLFLTNLVAITLTAMIVFLCVHLDTPTLKAQIRQWHQQEPESHWIQIALDRLPVSNKLQVIGSLPSRFIVILVPVILLIIPLNQALGRLQQEVITQERENRINQMATQVWRQNFADFGGEQPRSYLSALSSHEQDGRLILQLAVFTSKLYSDEEKQAYRQQVADQLGQALESVSLQLTQIPTASSVTQLIAKEKQVPQPLLPPPLPTVPETQDAFIETVDLALQPITLPSPAQLLPYQITISSDRPSKLTLPYLSPREIDRDAQSLLIDEIQDRLNLANGEIVLEHVPTEPGSLVFDLDQSEIQPASSDLLERVGTFLQQQPDLQLELYANSEILEPTGIAQARVQTIRNLLKTQWQIPAERVKFRSSKVLERGQQPTVDLKISTL